jgi:hypothetical protein
MNHLLKEMKKNLKKVSLKQVRRKRAAKKSEAPLKFSSDDLPSQFHQVAPLDWIPEPYRSQIRSAKPVKATRPPAVRKKQRRITLH